mgnify:FL=1
MELRYAQQGVESELSVDDGVSGSHLFASTKYADGSFFCSHADPSEFLTPNTHSIGGGEAVAVVTRMFITTCTNWFSVFGAYFYRSHLPTYRTFFMFRSILSKTTLAQKLLGHTVAFDIPFLQTTLTHSAHRYLPKKELIVISYCAL